MKSEFQKINEKYGSFVPTGAEGNKIDFSGLSADIDKLPKSEALSTGSTAYCVDTGALYIYEQSTKTWYLQ